MWIGTVGLPAEVLRCLGLDAIAAGSAARLEHPFKSSVVSALSSPIAAGSAARLEHSFKTSVVSAPRSPIASAITPTGRASTPWAPKAIIVSDITRP